MAARNAALLPRKVDQDAIELAELHVEHRAGQLVHPQVQSEERPLADLGAVAQAAGDPDRAARSISRSRSCVSVTSMPPSPHVMVLYWLKLYAPPTPIEPSRRPW